MKDRTPRSPWKVWILPFICAASFGIIKDNHSSLAQSTSFFSGFQEFRSSYPFRMVFKTLYPTLSLPLSCLFFFLIWFFCIHKKKTLYKLFTVHWCYIQPFFFIKLWAQVAYRTSHHPSFTKFLNKKGFVWCCRMLQYTSQ